MTQLVTIRNIQGVFNVQTQELNAQINKTEENVKQYLTQTELELARLAEENEQLKQEMQQMIIRLEQMDLARAAEIKALRQLHQATEEKLAFKEAEVEPLRQEINHLRDEKVESSVAIQDLNLKVSKLELELQTTKTSSEAINKANKDLIKASHSQVVHLQIEARLKELKEKQALYIEVLKLIHNTVTSIYTPPIYVSFVVRTKLALDGLRPKVEEAIKLQIRPGSLADPRIATLESTLVKYHGIVSDVQRELSYLKENFTGENLRACVSKTQAQIEKVL